VNAYLFAFLVPTEGFGGEPSTLGQFTAVNSGLFSDPNIWSEKIVPYGSSNVTIAAGAFVTIPRGSLDINVTRIDVRGGLAMGTPINDSFKLLSPLSITVYSGGNLTDLSGGKKLIAPDGTLLTIYPGGSFTGNGSTLTTPTQSRASPTAESRLSIQANSRSGYTCGILTGGSIQQFPRVTYMVTASGNFFAGSAFLGGSSPSPSVCTFVGGCGLSVSLSFTLSMSFPGGRLDVNIAAIEITVSASMNFGTPGLATGFRFVYAVRITLYGTMREVSGTTGGIYVTHGSDLWIYTGGALYCVVPTTVYIVDPATGLAGAQTVSLGIFTPGPFFLSINGSGSIFISVSSKETSKRSSTMGHFCNCSRSGHTRWRFNHG
jgi:hypothetical protein